MINLRLILIALLLSLLPAMGFALPYYGATLSTVLISTEPVSLRGYQFLLSYDPQCFKWHQFNLYFDGGINHLWVTKYTKSDPYYQRDSSLNIYSLSPVIRYSFSKLGPISPYIDISIGLAYFSQTRIDDRNLGMHPTFQDRIGLGFLVGTKQQFSLGIHAVHYSNACLSAHNNGITIPLELDLGYRFS
jgi:hypothetical protein